MELNFIEKKKLLTERKKYCCKRVAKDRLLKAVKAHEERKHNSKTPFKTLAALAKATARAHRAVDQVLSKTPNRQQAANKELFRKSFGEFSLDKQDNKRSKPPHVISDETAEIFRMFYQRDIS